jgi:hypothetical protein
MSHRAGRHVRPAADAPAALLTHARHPSTTTPGTPATNQPAKQSHLTTHEKPRLGRRSLRVAARWRQPDLSERLDADAPRQLLMAERD